MSEQCNHKTHNWNVVYQCRNCNEVVPEEIAEGYLAQLEAENEALKERDEKVTKHLKTFVSGLVTVEQMYMLADALLTGDDDG